MMLSETEEQPSFWVLAGLEGTGLFLTILSLHEQRQTETKEAGVVPPMTTR